MHQFSDDVVEELITAGCAKVVDVDEDGERDIVFNLPCLAENYPEYHQVLNDNLTMTLMQMEQKGFVKMIWNEATWDYDIVFPDQ